jgi:alpha-galactosidase/6-phospho-beta-glucosidase family protein
MYSPGAEFIHLIATEANEVCEKDSKKTISTQHIIGALTSLGFDDYIPQLQTESDEYKQQKQQRDKRNSRLENSGMSQEELLKMQQELFQQAREKMLKGETM